MNYSYYPTAEAEFLKSVGYYESKVPGLGGSIEEFEVLVTRPRFRITSGQY